MIIWPGVLLLAYFAERFTSKQDHMPHTGLSFFHNGISFSYLIKTRNVTDGTRVGETKIHLTL